MYTLPQSRCCSLWLRDCAGVFHLHFPNKGSPIPKKVLEASPFPIHSLICHFTMGWSCSPFKHLVSKPERGTNRPLPRDPLLAESGCWLAPPKVRLICFVWILLSTVLYSAPKFRVHLLSWFFPPPALSCSLGNWDLGVACSVSLSSWSLLTQLPLGPFFVSKKATPMFQAASLALLATHHKERDTSPL